MRAADLDIHELLHFVPEGGLITFAGERVLLLDAVALGLLRKELIETLGATAARAVLTRFGYAHGWRVAETLRKGFPWDSEDYWRAAGARLHTIQGLVRAEVTHASLSPAAPGAEGARTPCLPGSTTPTGAGCNCSARSYKDGVWVTPRRVGGAAIRPAPGSPWRRRRARRWPARRRRTVR